MSSNAAIMNFSSCMTVSFITLFVLIGSNFIGTFTVNAAHDGCQGLLESFAEVTANFTRCTIQNARPIKVCQACVDTYINVLQSYEKILKLHDDADGTPCKLELINVDRLEVVAGSYNFVVNQWNRANCNNCFQNESGTITPKKNNYTVEVVDLAANLDACINNNKNNDTNSTVNSQVCINCTSDYHLLNLYYNDNKSLAHGYCMDIVDLINSTRNSWSQDFHCCAEREQPELAFLVIASSFCFIPLVFYLLVGLCSVKHLLPILPTKRWDQYLTSSSSTTNLIQS